MNCNANGFAQQVVTCESASDLAAGTLVKMTGNYTVEAAASGDPLFGAVLNCRGGVCAVQVQGALTLPYTGSAPAVGIAKLACAGADKLKTDANGLSVRVLAVDAVRSTVTCIL